jgi:hypothetical protein
MIRVGRPWNPLLLLMGPGPFSLMHLARSNKSSSEGDTSGEGKFEYTDCDSIWSRILGRNPDKSFKSFPLALQIHLYSFALSFYLFKLTQTKNMKYEQHYPNVSHSPSVHASIRTYVKKSPNHLLTQSL